MSWILLAAIVGSTVAIVYVACRKWILPWRHIERLVREIGPREQPRTFLMQGGKEAQRVGVALEDIFRRQQELNRQIDERASGQKAILSAMQDGLLVVDGRGRQGLLNRAVCNLFEIGDDSVRETR